VETLPYRQLKKQEAQSRMAAVSKAGRSSRSASESQRRASLVGSGPKWRITNFSQVARAMAKWA